jgi:4-amino-4-deoxy-L-arabinose transferase-like glycosyltransferase
VLGVVVFYYCARILFAQRALAMWGSAIYAWVFYVWFSAEIHSTYASQLFFPVLVFYCFLQYERTGRAWHLYLAAAAFAIGTGMRPSDGAFLLPFVCWRLIRLRPRNRVVVACAVITVLCLAWLVPTAFAYERVHWSSLSGFKGTIGPFFAGTLSQRSFVAKGFNSLTLANVTRVLVALLFAFWPFLLPLILRRNRRLDSRAIELALWIIPGLVFFLISYFADAPYLNFATAPIILLGLLLLENCTKRIITTTAVLCLVWNVGFFLFFRPAVTRSLPMNIVNVYAGRFTLFSLKHRASPDLSEVVKDPSLVKGY